VLEYLKSGSGFFFHKSGEITIFTHYVYIVMLNLKANASPDFIYGL
jgi:hypothetical protein